MRRNKHPDIYRVRFVTNNHVDIKHTANKTKTNENENGMDDGAKKKN